MAAHQAITFTSRRRRRRRRPPRRPSTSICTSRCSCRTPSRSRTPNSSRNRSVIFAQINNTHQLDFQSNLHRTRSVLVVPASAVRPVHAVPDRPEAAQFFAVAAVFPAAGRPSGMQNGLSAAGSQHIVDIRAPDQSLVRRFLEWEFPRSRKSDANCLL